MMVKPINYLKDHHRLQRNAGRANPPQMKLELRLAEQSMQAILVLTHLHTNMKRGNTAQCIHMTSPYTLRTVISSAMYVFL